MMLYGEDVCMVNAFEAPIVVSMTFILWLGQSMVRAVGWSGVVTQFLLTIPPGVYAFVAEEKDAKYFQEPKAMHYTVRLVFNLICMLLAFVFYLPIAIDTTEDFKDFEPVFNNTRALFTDGELKNSTAHIGDFFLMQTSVNFWFSSYIRSGMNVAAIIVSLHLQICGIGPHKQKKPVIDAKNKITNPNHVAVVITSNVNRNVGTPV